MEDEYEFTTKLFMIEEISCNREPTIKFRCWEHSLREASLYTDKAFCQL